MASDNDDKPVDDGDARRPLWMACWDFVPRLETGVLAAIRDRGARDQFAARCDHEPRRFRWEGRESRLDLSIVNPE